MQVFQLCAGYGSWRATTVVRTSRSVRATIGRVRALARAVAQAYYDSRERLGFPMVAK